ncbi:MAG: hypothetical protein CL675_13030 [Bdellovibrionaceae bacterium]|nr:hypothetical protein [Pseudobdellovibrionaceae bacterium]
MSLIAVALLCFVSAIFSSLFGLAGGAMLLFGLNFFYSPFESVYLHGLFQNITGYSRLAVFYQEVRWRFVGVFAVGTLVGGQLVSMTDLIRYQSHLLVLTSVAILIFAFLPKPKQQFTQRTALALLFAGGILCGFLGPLIAVVGPLATPFFMMAGQSKEALVATKGASLLAVHGVKMVVVSGWSAGATSYDQFYEAPFLGTVAVALIGGVFFGRWLMKAFSIEKHDLVVKALLALIAVGFIYQAMTM